MDKKRIQMQVRDSVFIRLDYFVDVLLPGKNWSFSIDFINFGLSWVSFIPAWYHGWPYKKVQEGNDQEMAQ